MDSLALLEDLVRIPGPPGEEGLVRSYLADRLAEMGLASEVDAKGNLIVRLGRSERPPIVVAAHMDEIAMIVRRVEPDGSLAVGPLGGMKPWKLGEGPVSVLTDFGPIDAVFSFGSVHSAESGSPGRRGETEPITWEMGRVILGAAANGVRPGTRVVVHPTRRSLLSMPPLVGGYFLDDRADLVSWLMALDDLKDTGIDAAFIATVSEEVGGEGALYALHRIQPDVCIALELGPIVADAPVALNDQPTVWANDSYAAMSASDGRLLADLGKELGLDLQFQSLSRGGSDASCAAAKGHCARPITLGLPMQNTHGFELIHQGSMANLAKLTAGLVRRLAA